MEAASIERLNRQVERTLIRNRNAIRRAERSSSRLERAARRSDKIVENAVRRVRENA